MRTYVAGVIVTGLDFLCHLFNHYPLPCRWVNNRFHNWAFNILNPMSPLPSASSEECGRYSLPSTGYPLRCNRPKGHAGCCGRVQPGASIMFLK